VSSEGFRRASKQQAGGKSFRKIVLVRELYKVTVITFIIAITV